MLSEEEIIKAKIQGLYEFGIPRKEARQLLARFDGDMLLVAGYADAEACAVFVKGDRELWNMKRAEGFKADWVVTPDFKIESRVDRDLRIFKAKIQGLREFGLSLPEAGRLLKMYDGDMLQAAGHHAATGLCVNIKGDSAAWRRNYAADVASRYLITDDFKLLPKPGCNEFGSSEIEP